MFQEIVERDPNLLFELWVFIAILVFAVMGKYFCDLHRKKKTIMSDIKAFIVAVFFSIPGMYYYQKNHEF